jgi:hypothetical protein
MSKKKFTVFCPVKNETTFSPIWLKYYSRFLSTDDIYFLDFNSDIKPSGCQVKSTERNIFDANELFETIKEFHKELLNEYEYVIPTDVDEIIFHKSGLNNYINYLQVDYVKCAGFELIHIPSLEKDFDETKPIFSQRKYWFRSPIYYDKTLITKKPLDWTIGLHTTNTQSELDINLLLIHLHRFDFETCIKRHLKYANSEWSDNTIKNNYNWHYRTNKREKLENWYFNTGYQITEIPEEIRLILNI